MEHSLSELCKMETALFYLKLWDEEKETLGGGVSIICLHAWTTIAILDRIQI